MARTYIHSYKGRYKYINVENLIQLMDIGYNKYYHHCIRQWKDTGYYKKKRQDVKSRIIHKEMLQEIEDYLID